MAYQDDCLQELQLVAVLFSLCITYYQINIVMKHRLTIGYKA